MLGLFCLYQFSWTFGLDVWSICCLDSFAFIPLPAWILSTSLLTWNYPTGICVSLIVYHYLLLHLERCVAVFQFVGPSSWTCDTLVKVGHNLSEVVFVGCICLPIVVVMSAFSPVCLFFKHELNIPAGTYQFFTVVLLTIHNGHWIVWHNI